MSILPYAEAGDGVPLLMIHGFPHDRRLWREQLDGLRRNACVIAPDLRGFGQAPPAPEGMTIEDHAADLKALMDHKRISKAVICGLSMGGYVALAFAERYPKAVQRLILCSTRSGADDAKAKEGRTAMARRISENGVEQLADAMLPKMLAASTIKGSTEAAATVRLMMATQAPAGLIAALHAMAARPDRTGLLASIKVPTRVIAGTADAMIPSSESEAMAHAIPGSDLMLIPEAGHLPNVDAPKAFNSALRAFLVGMHQEAKG
ncbi:MAG: alpha/beta fold hydrolase [Flavobacteriales bacterium]